MNCDVKRRMMFIANEDFNYLSYTLIVTLDALGCRKQTHPFKDIQKFALLSNLLSDPYMKYFLASRDRPIGTSHNMAALWAATRRREPLFNRAVYSLERHGLIKTELDAFDRRTVYLLDKCIDTVVSKLRQGHFMLEYENLERLRKEEPRIRTLKYKTLLHRLLPYAKEAE